MTKITNISVLPDASQSFLEVYRKRQQKGKGCTEKRLLGTTVIFAILFVLFFMLFLLAEYYYNQLKKEKVCTSKECIESAMTLLQTVDFSQDPCEDFYKFACGKFDMDHPIPENYLHNSWFVEKENRLGRLILDILKSPVSPTDVKSVRQTKEFYQACTNKSELNSVGLKPLYDILELLELPKSIPNNKTTENFNLGKTLALAQRFLSQDILVAVSISRKTYNDSESSNKNSTILKISPGLNGINVFDVWKPQDIFSGKRWFKFRRKTDFGHPVNADKKTSRQVVLATIKFISAILEEISNDQITEEEIPNNNFTSFYTTTAYKIMTFTSELVKDSNAGFNDTENNSTGVEEMTFSTLQFILDEGKSNSSSNRIDWREYISTLFEKVNNTYDPETEPIVVENLEYFKFLTKVLGEAKPETIQRHVWWKIIEQYAKYTTSNMRAIYYRYYEMLYGEGAFGSRSQICGSLLKNKMNAAISYQMSRMNNFSRTSQKVHEMLKDIEKAFEGLVKSMSWMDSQSKSITLDKASSVKNKIGFAEWIMDAEKIEKHYQGLELKKSEFLKNIMRISEWEVHRILELIGPDKENSTGMDDGWYINPLQVNAYYSRDDNAIKIRIFVFFICSVIPPGILQTPFYFRGLESLNYGAIGTILGHELTHGFDIEGKNYNKFGERQYNWWPHEITQRYESKSKCFIRQYENYTLYEDNKVNGTLTLAENIADNGGIRESFRAYQLFVKRNGYEQKLPGFENFTHEQLLFLSYANIWCEASLPKYYKLSQDSHSPQRVRVLATLQNMYEFSRVYNCSKNSFMNPDNKCVIWDNNSNLGQRMISWLFLIVEIIILNVKIFVEMIRSFIRMFTSAEEASVVGEKVLITGAGHGIGKELARQYGELGAEIICVDINSQTNQQTVSELRKIGIKAYGFECDVSKREKVIELKKKVKDTVGDVTILVNNAGIMPTKRWKDHTPEDITRIFEINVFAHFWLFEAFLPSMIEKDHGHVVALSSVAGMVGFPHVTAYCGSKFAVRGTMEALAEEFRAEGKNIKFTTVYPYMTNTGLCKKVKIRFPAIFSMQEPKFVAAQVISAQRKGVREIMIPSFMRTLHDFGRLLPERAQMSLIDFLDSGLCID